MSWAAAGYASPERTPDASSDFGVGRVQGREAHRRVTQMRVEEDGGTPRRRVGVSSQRFVDADARLVAASMWENGRGSELGVWSDETEARIPPFDAGPRDVAAWWQSDPETAAGG